MAGKVLELNDLIDKDQMGCSIASQWVTWKNSRIERETLWEEVRRYIYATDTTFTSNGSLPWKNKTTVPKLCQIRDNLYANYIAAMFPKRNWITWEGDTVDDELKQKRDAIENYMNWAVERSQFRQVIESLLLDYIDYGRCFGIPIWVDQRVSSAEDGSGTKIGYVGPSIQRLSPMDVVFNPIAPSVEQSPKIVRSFITVGEAAELLQRESVDEDVDAWKEIFNYLMNVRHNASSFEGELRVVDGYFQMDGFNSFREYLQSNYVEVLTFYGDLFDIENNQLLKNHVIMVMDRHKVVAKRPNTSLSGTDNIASAGWRKRQDNLWSMGPLDNLVGMQYRIDHLENMKADLFDLTTYPPLKIKGEVSDFTWAPLERIYIGDNGDLELMSPDVQALSVNLEIQQLEAKMEEMAGAPKEAMGFRTPGEKTAYEVQSLENGASRIFQSKITQFEIEVVEPLLNGMLTLAKQKMDSSTAVRVFNDDQKIITFNDLTAADITGQGRIRPLAARHFAEKAEQIQNLSNFYQSAAGADPMVRNHFSSIGVAKMISDLLDLDRFNLVSENIRILEQSQAQTLSNVAQEQAANATMTPAGLEPDDTDQDF